MCVCVYIIFCLWGIEGYRNPAVPSRETLKKMFPSKKFEPECLFPVTFETYNQWLSVQSVEYATRQKNLNASYYNISSIYKTNTTDQKEEVEIFLEPTDFCFRMETKKKYFGIETRKAKTNQRCVYDFSLCSCKKKPSNILKKQFMYQARFNEGMIHPNTPEFRSLRYTVEKKVLIFKV